jgi:biopolymer transport protein ExbD
MKALARSFGLLFVIIVGQAPCQDAPGSEPAPETVRVLATETNLSGISAILRRMPDDGRIVVVGLIEGGPAEKAGMLVDDEITAVDGHSTQGERLEDVIARVRGEPGTKVSVTIQRSGSAQTLEIIRDLVRLKDLVTPVEIMVKGDRYWTGEHELDLSMIATVLNERASRDKAWPVKIKADKESPYSALQRILEICRDAHLINVEVISPDDKANSPIQ